MNPDVFHPLRLRLVEQLSFIDENRDIFLNTYFPRDRYTYEERMKYNQFFNRYVSTVEDVIRQLGGSSDSTDSTLPHVLIGSEVSLKYLQDNEEESVTICFPEKADPDQGMVSFLSPIGTQILLLSAGETVQLSTPNGTETVKIRDIKWNDW